MDDILFTNLLKAISVTAGVIGVLLGLDLIFGTPVINFLKRSLDKSFDFEKMIARPKVKKGLGVVLVILSFIIILLIKSI